MDNINDFYLPNNLFIMILSIVKYIPLLLLPCYKKFQYKSHMYSIGLGYSGILNVIWIRFNKIAGMEVKDYIRIPINKDVR